MGGCASAKKAIDSDHQWPPLSDAMRRKLEKIPQPDLTFNSLVVVEWTFPLSFDTGEILPLLRTDLIDHRTLKDYRVNHIHLGVLGPDKIKELVKIFHPIDVVTRRYPLSKVLRPTYATPRNARKTAIRISLPPEAPRTQILPRGHFQFLAKLKTYRKDSKSLHLIPQHGHWTSSHLFPVSLGERALEGTTFDALSIDLYLPKAHALVMTLIREGEVKEPLKLPGKKDSATEGEKGKLPGESGGVKKKGDEAKGDGAKAGEGAEEKEKEKEKEKDIKKKKKPRMTAGQKLWEDHHKKTQEVLRYIGHSLGAKFLAKKYATNYHQTILFIYIERKSQ